MSVRVNSPHVISETIEGETIIIHLGTGVYYSIQDGHGLWDAIGTTASISHLTTIAQKSCGVSEDLAHRGVVSFICDLRDEELVVVEDEEELSREATEESVGSDGNFRPRLTTYTDMKELVLLDPVHDVGDAGWPQKAAGAGG